MTNLVALKQAKYVWDHRTTTDRQGRFDAAVELAEWNLFSNAQIARFTMLDPHVIGAITHKTDYTGGRLPGEALEHLIAYLVADARNETDHSQIWKAIATGASTRMVARLLGMSQSNVMKWRNPR